MGLSDVFSVRVKILDETGKAIMSWDDVKHASLLGKDSGFNSDRVAKILTRDNTTIYLSLAINNTLIIESKKTT